MLKSKNFIYPTPLGRVSNPPPPFPPENHIVRGEEGVPWIIFLVEYDYFCYLGVHAKFQAPPTILSGRMSNNRRKIYK
jgi:hypothetical protein